jgi:hypothetical protein
MGALFTCVTNILKNLQKTHTETSCESIIVLDNSRGRFSEQVDVNEINATPTFSGAIGYGNSTDRNIPDI